MIKAHKQIALFDTDKTLIEISHLVDRALDETMHKVFGIHGVLGDLSPSEYAGQHMAYIIARLVEKKTDYEHWYIDSKIEDAMRNYVGALNSHLTEHTQPRRLVCPGVYQFLDALRATGIHRGVFTGGISDVHKKVLEVTGLGGYFEATCTSDHKSAVDRVQLINMCIKDLRPKIGSLPTNNIAVFGDAPNDIRSANKYKAKSVGILEKSLFSEKDLQNEKPFKIYESFRDYKKIIYEVFGVKV